MALVPSDLPITMPAATSCAVSVISLDSKNIVLPNKKRFYPQISPWLMDGKKRWGGIRSRYIVIPIFVPSVSAYDAVQFIFCCKLILVHSLRILIICKSQWEAWSIRCILETFAVLQVVDTLLSEHTHVQKKLTLACCTMEWKTWEERKTWVSITFSTTALCIASVRPSPSV